MSFFPAIPVSGFVGWRIFEQSAEAQKDIFAGVQSTQRNIAYFKDNLISADSAENLVKDRRLLTVALGAFGLSEEIDKKALIRRVLEDGTDDTRSFANRLNDTRWRNFAKAFGYGNVAGAPTASPAFREKIANQYIDRAFEERVGEVNTDMRLAMNFRREIAIIAENSAEQDVKWLQIMGQKPLRQVVEAALGLPASIGSVDLDRQVEVFQKKAEALFGSSSPAIFTDPEVVDSALRRFFLQSDIQNGPSPSTPGMAALNILSAPPPLGSGAQIANLVISNTI